MVRALPSSTPDDEHSTPEMILDAALRVLGRDGFQSLTSRAIAEEAGVNHALINYYFGGKEKLLLEMAAALDGGKYARQWQMYHEPGVPLSRKWRQAVAFYRQDLADGFIRINQEMYALGFSNPAIAEWALNRLNRWQALLDEAARAYLPTLGIRLPPELVVSALVSFWLGMNMRFTDGATEEDGHFFAILDFIGDWLEERERQCGLAQADRHVAEVPGTD